MTDFEPDEWAVREFGGEIPDDVLDLCSQVAAWIRAYVVDTDHWFGSGNIDWVRITIQSKLMDLVAEAVRRDRQREGPDFFSSVPGKFKPWVRRPAPPLRSWIRRNGKRAGRPSR